MKQRHPYLVFELPAGEHEQYRLVRTFNDDVDMVARRAAWNHTKTALDDWYTAHPDGCGPVPTFHVFRYTYKPNNEK